MIIVGIDEVGRGCWAGPLVAAAVVLNDDIITGLKDSKKLTAKARTMLSGEINGRALFVGIGWVEPAYIDENGLTKATELAMRRAIEDIAVQYDQIIIDGNINFLSENPKSQCLIKADDTVPAVSAASIVAKVSRDEFMKEIAIEYPGYGFENHVGYGTAEHIKALKLNGVTSIHRMSYKPIKQIILARA